MPVAHQTNPLPPIASHRNENEDLRKSSIGCKRNPLVILETSTSTHAHDKVENNQSSPVHSSRIVTQSPIPNINKRVAHCTEDHDLFERGHMSCATDNGTGICVACLDQLQAVYSHCFPLKSQTLANQKPIEFVISTHANDSAAPPQSPARASNPPKINIMYQEISNPQFDPKKIHQGGGSSAVQPRWKDSFLKRVGGVMKDKEIQKLRGSLDLKPQEENLPQHCSVHRESPINTLEDVTDACVFQENEVSNREKQLNGHIGALMAMLIQSEKEKSKILAQVNVQKDVIDQKDKLLDEKNNDIRLHQDKLQQTYKEYLEMNNLVERMEREVVEGTSTASARADRLAFHLDQLAKEYEHTSRTAIDAQERQRQLEFELSAIITQFNEVGDAHHSLQKEHKDLAHQFSELTTQHKHLSSEYSATKNELKKVTDQFHSEQETHSKIRDASNAEIKTLQTSLKDITSAKSLADALIARLKAESEKLRASEINLRSMISDLDLKLIELQNTYTQDTEALRKTNQSLTKDLETVSGNLVKVTDHRERLQVQVNDFRGSLDRERNRSKVIETDLKNLKGTSHKTQTDLENQVNALTASKNALAADKKELMDTLTGARRDLIESKVAQEEMEASHIQWTAAKNEQVASLNTIIESVKGQLQALDTKYMSLVDAHKSLDKDNKEHVIQLNTTQIMVSERTKSLQLANEHIKSLQATQSHLEKLLENEKETVQDQTNAVAFLTNQISDMEAGHEQARDEWHVLGKDLNEQINKLTFERNNFQNELDALTVTYNKFILTNEQTKKDKVRLSHAMLQESNVRTELEVELHHLQQLYNTELQVRAGYEKLNQNLEKRASKWASDKVNAWVQREQAWSDLDAWVSKESGRLDEMINMLGLSNMHVEDGYVPSSSSHGHHSPTTGMRVKIK